MIIDTHCHLDFKQFDADRETVIKRAVQSGVKYIINIGSSLEGSRKSVELAVSYDAIFAAVGIHPHDSGSVNEDIFSEIRALVKNKKVVAIGEVGLDYAKSLSPPDKQRKLFENFIELSKETKLPLVIHSRGAHEDLLNILGNSCSSPISGVMHCFSGNKEVLKKALEMGLFVSFTCNLTFKNAKSLREVAKCVPPDRLLLETDAPFLAPQTYRGKRNEPAYITELRDTLASILNMPKFDVERITTDNAKKLFKLEL